MKKRRLLKVTKYQIFVFKFFNQIVSSPSLLFPGRKIRINNSMDVGRQLVVTQLPIERSSERRSEWSLGTSYLIVGIYYCYHHRSYYWTLSTPSRVRILISFSCFFFNPFL